MKRLFLLMLAITLAACSGKKQQITSGATFAGAPIILISVDTLRSDRLPAYGYNKVATPSLDRFAKDSILYEHAYSNVPLTLPSHLTVFTGMLPQAHGVRDNIGFSFDSTKAPTLASLLKSNGYATGAAISAYVLRRSTGVAEGFDDYDDNIPSSSHAALSTLMRGGAATLNIARTWLDAHKDQKSFYFAHIYEPHAPYTPPEPFKSQFADPYDGEVAHADAIIGDFLAHLRSNGTYDRALIIIFSDHGEGLMEHGEQEHGILLNREAIQVPLLVKLPKQKQAGLRVSSAVSLADIFPTVLQGAGIKAPVTTSVSLLETAVKPNLERAIFSETMYPRIHLGWSELRSMATATHHLIDAPTPELFDLRSDPGETKNVLQSERRVYSRLRKEVDALGKEIALPTNVDPEEAAKLAALGYISASRPTAATDLPDPKTRIHQIEQVKKAYNLADSHQFPEAIRELKRLVSENPAWTDSWAKLGFCYEAVGDLQAAADTYKRAITVTPTLAPEFALQLASIQMKMGEFDAAKAHAELALKTNPGGAHQVMGEVALARGDVDTATREAALTMQHNEFRLQAQLLSARIASTTGRLEEALQRLDRLEHEARLAERLPFAYLEFVRGDVLARMERPAQAVEAFKKEIVAFPLNRQAYANLALLQLIGGDTAGARTTLDRMTVTNPDRNTMLFAAKTLATLGDERGAATYRQRAGAAP